MAADAQVIGVLPLMMAQGKRAVTPSPQTCPGLPRRPEKIPQASKLMNSPQTLPLQPVADQPEPNRPAETLEDVPDTDVTNYDPRAPWGQGHDDVPDVAFDPNNPWAHLE